MGRFTNQDSPPRGSLADIKRDVFDSLDEEEQRFIFRLADEIRSVLTASGEVEAAKYLGKQILDGDEYIALWSVLKSFERTAVKRGLESIRKGEKT